MSEMCKRAVALLAPALAVVLVLAVAPPATGQPRAPEPPRPWLGVLLGNAVDGGVRVAAVVPGGPAEQAGLRAGDVLLRLGERPIVRSRDVGAALEDARAGETLTIEVVRDGVLVLKRIRPSVREAPAPPVIAERLALEPLPAPAALPRPGLGSLLGVRLSDLSPELRRHYGAPADSGVLVVRTSPERAGSLAVGDVLIKACGERVERADSNPCARRDEQRVVVVDVVRRGEPRMLKVELPDGYAAPAEAGGPRSAGAVTADTRSRELRVRMLELEISRLERRLAELRRELDTLR